MYLPSRSSQFHRRPEEAFNNYNLFIKYSLLSAFNDYSLFVKYSLLSAVLDVRLKENNAGGI